MKLHPKLALGLAVVAMALVPTMAGAVSYHPEYHPETPQGPKVEPPGHAYGYHCRGFSKKHVKGQQGTPFSQCVHALKVADNNDNKTARKACKALKTAANKHKPHGDKGTAFSRCIKAVNEMRREQAATVTASAAA
jgi:hypothetical protein